MEILIALFILIVIIVSLLLSGKNESIIKLERSIVRNSPDITTANKILTLYDDKQEKYLEDVRSSSN